MTRADPEPITEGVTRPGRHSPSPATGGPPERLWWAALLGSVADEVIQDSGSMSPTPAGPQAAPGVRLLLGLEVLAARLQAADSPVCVRLARAASGVMTDDISAILANTVH